MIEFTLAQLAAWAIGASLVLIALFAWISRWSNRNAERRSLRARVTCRTCLHVFEDHGSHRVVRCTHCGSDTERGRSRSLG